MNGSSAVLSGVFADRYAIERELGRGGTAVVYLARDKHRGHAVAIKVLRPELAQSVGSERFLKEIQLSQRLHHPHILPVLDSGEAEGQLYFVLAHMEGGTLRTRLERDKQLPLEEAIAITRAIAMALEHAHEQGLVHRDVKPENILFTSGQACLGDFGIARALERAMGDLTTTSISVVRGTAAYMSPEQASGELTYDGRTDVYSLACVLYEMLAGIQPFMGPTFESVIAQRLAHAPRSVRVYRPAIPKAVAAVIDKAMMISPADRYQRAKDFADALEIAAQTPDASASRESRRRLLIRAGIITAALAVVGSAIFRMVTTPASASGVLPEGDPRRIAVLYFDDLTPTSVPNYVVDGLTEDLIDKLGAVRALHVISPNGVRPFRGSAIPLDSIGRALKVGTIVSGSVARLGNTMRINVRLADARTGRQLYSQPIEQQWTGVFALQDQLANQVSFFLRQRLGDEIALRENRGATKSDAAWETVQLAAVDLRSATEILTTRDDPRASQLLLRPDSLYARAEQLDPTWDHPTVKRGDIALAMATQATTIPARPTSPPNGIDSVRYRRMTPSGRRVLWLQRAIELGDSAVRRSPRSAEALSLRGDARYRLAATDARAYDTLARLAERDLRAAIDLRPDAARAWSILASIGIDQGRFAEAAEAAERAYEADAFFEQRRIVSTAFFAALHSDQFDKARRWCRIGLQHYAGDPRFAECELTLLGWTGRTRRDAAAAWRTLTRIEQGDTQQMLGATWGYRRLMVAAVLARSGQRDSVRSLLAATIGEQRRDPTKRGHPLGKAYVHLLLNERDSAVAQLRDYVRALPRARTLIGAHPWFRTLKGDPRFDELVQPTR